MFKKKQLNLKKIYKQFNHNKLLKENQIQIYQLEFLFNINNNNNYYNNIYKISNNLINLFKKMIQINIHLYINLVYQQHHKMLYYKED